MLLSLLDRCIHVPPVIDQKGEELKLEDEEENANKQEEELIKRDEIEEESAKPASAPTAFPENIELVKTTEQSD